MVKDKTHWVTVACEPDWHHRTTKAAEHIGISRSELIRIATSKYLQDKGLWSIPGPARSGGDQRPPRASKHALREEVETDE